MVEFFGLRAPCFLTHPTLQPSVLFNFLNRDFFNALSEKDAARFTGMLFKWLGALAAGIPVFVFRDYLQSRLALEWRQWLTDRLTADYLAHRSFYRLAATGAVDNPDQRIAADVGAFTDAFLGLALTLLSAAVDLVSFSGILASIYPPLFAALLIYSVGGTATSLWLGRPLIRLNFAQEAAEADLRYALVRVRENAESVAFYGGEAGEAAALRSRLAAAVANGLRLLSTSRNLAFFTSLYRYLIMILPAAVVAPLYFRGAIELGVIQQSSSAFNHVLSDVSLVVYQLESLAGFSAVVDRLGEFSEAVAAAKDARGGVVLTQGGGERGAPLLSVDRVTLFPPGAATATTTLPLVSDLTFDVARGDSLLVMGPSGAGKTSILRAAAGLWSDGGGRITRVGGGDVFFVPQRPYVVLGSLRDQLLYPGWTSAPDGSDSTDGAARPTTSTRPPPTDAQMEAALRTVRLGVLLDRADPSGRVQGTGLDAVADWAAILSLGEQQRLAFARVLLARPSLVLMDESTSALDVANEAAMYAALKEAGVSYVSVGHRPTLTRYHSRLLRLVPGEGGGKAQSGWSVGPLSEADAAAAAA